MLKLSLCEQIKAFPDSASHLSPYAKEKWLELKAKLEALMAHLQTRPRLISCYSRGTKGKRAREWFEELDKHIAGTSDVVCIKRSWFKKSDRQLYDSKTLDFPNDDEMQLIIKGKEEMLKELLDQGDAPQKEG